MATINILGEIGWSVEAEEVIKQIQAIKDDKIKVIIASPGGSAFQGLMIHDALKASKKEITTVILGLGASAASIIFLAGDKREMGESGLLMVHNSRTMVGGTAAEVREQLEAMDAIDERMKSVVMNVGGISDEDATALLGKDSFMNLEEAMELGLATDSIQDDIAASLNMNKTKKEPVKMATEEETKQAGFFAHMAAWFKNSEVKAMDDEDEKKPEDEEAKAMDDDEGVEVEEEKESDDEKAMDDDEEKSMDDEDDEKEEMKAKIESLEAELEAATAKAMDDEDEQKKDEEAKVSAILTGITDKKVTMVEAIKLSKKPLSEVSAHLDGLLANATGRGKTQEPASDASSKLDQWKAMKDEKNHGAAQKFYNKNSTEIRSEMSKEK